MIKAVLARVFLNDTHCPGAWGLYWWSLHKIIKVVVFVQVRERVGLPPWGRQGRPGKSVQVGHPRSLWRIRLGGIHRLWRQTASHLSQRLRQARAGTASLQPGNRTVEWVNRIKIGIVKFYWCLLISKQIVNLCLFFPLSLACPSPVCAQFHATLCLDPNIKWYKNLNPKNVIE